VACPSFTVYARRTAPAVSSEPTNEAGSTLAPSGLT
jgi:hypothetical protein